MDETPTRDRPRTIPRPGGCTGGWVAAADGAPAAGLAGQVDAGTERPAADLREARGGSAARAVDATATGPGSSARSCHASCVSVAGGAELVDDALWDAAARRDLDLLRLGPRSDRLGAVVHGGGRLPRGHFRSVLSATDLARGLYVAFQCCAHFVRVLIRQINLVPAAVESKTNGLAGTVDYLGVVQVIDESDDRTFRHQCSFVSVFAQTVPTGERRVMLLKSEIMHTAVAASGRNH